MTTGKFSDLKVGDKVFFMDGRRSKSLKEVSEITEDQIALKQCCDRFWISNGLEVDGHPDCSFRIEHATDQDIQEYYKKIEKDKLISKIQRVILSEISFEDLESIGHILKIK